jgi:hypothetical protein
MVLAIKRYSPLALKEFRTILYGYPVIIHTDHKNLAYDKTITTPQILCWRLAIEEFMPTLVWVPGVKNHVADLLSRHPIHTPKATEDENFDAGFDFRSTNINIAHEYTVPLDLKQIYQEQLNDPTIKPMQRESLESLGKIYDKTGERSGPQHTLTIIDPVLKSTKSDSGTTNTKTTSNALVSSHAHASWRRQTLQYTISTLLLAFYVKGNKHIC